MAVRNSIKDSIEVIIIALLLALLIRGFVVESFVVDGHSMEPTLHHGERLWVNKFIYFFSTPKRGEIVIFRYPLDPRRDFIKRVIAVSGDVVQINDGRVFINGKPISEPYLANTGNSYYNARRVPEGYIFVMGDNRTNSEDSRIFGFVPLKAVKGKAFLVYWPITHIRVLPQTAS